MSQELIKWEYRTEHGDFGEDRLSEWGSDGWELVTVIKDDKSDELAFTYFFKRPKQPKRG